VWPLSFVICVLILDVIYRYGPDRKHAAMALDQLGQRDCVGPLWLWGRNCSAGTVQSFPASYNRVYGRAGGRAVGFLTWSALAYMTSWLTRRSNQQLENRGFDAQQLAETREPSVSRPERTVPFGTF